MTPRKIEWHDIAELRPCESWPAQRVRDAMHDLGYLDGFPSWSTLVDAARHVHAVHVDLEDALWAVAQHAMDHHPGLLHRWAEAVVLPLRINRAMARRSPRSVVVGLVVTVRGCDDEDRGWDLAMLLAWLVDLAEGRPVLDPDAHDLLEAAGLGWRQELSPATPGATLG